LDAASLGMARVLARRVGLHLLFAICYFLSVVRCVNERFFEIISREEKVAYVPLSQLLRIEASPRAGIFLNFSESFQVNIEVADGAEPAVVKNLYKDLVSGSTDPIRLNPDTLNITHIHF
jgi:hypothetical protein